ncbi:MAG: hypothetical protein WAN28_10515 [Terracidiphilus sp.]
MEAKKRIMNFVRIVCEVIEQLVGRKDSDMISGRQFRSKETVGSVARSDQVGARAIEVVEVESDVSFGGSGSGWYCRLRRTGR